MDTELQRKLQALREEKVKLLKQIQETAKQLFKEASATLFEQYPVIEEFRWTQYTPYFNDGDACTFSSNHSYAKVVFNDTESTPIHQKAGEAVLEFLEDFDDDDMYAMFGDHVRVVVTKNGVEAEDYDHD